MPEAAVQLAGYQGEGSILTASLRLLARGLEGSALAAEVEADVTRGGGTVASLLASVEGGHRQVAYAASSYLSARVPELAVLDLPFSVTDREQALRALDGEAGTLLREAVANRTGFHVLAFWDNGFRHLTNAVRPLRTPADCAGLVIRTLDSDHYRALLAALGFTPVTTDVKDLVRAVETGAVQAQENPLTNFVGFGLWRHHPHASLSGHLFGVLLLLCPRRWFAGLARGERSALEDAVAAATTRQRELAASQDSDALATLRSHGVAVLGPDEIDLPAMRAATQVLATRQRHALPAHLLNAYSQANPAHA